MSRRLLSLLLACCLSAVAHSQSIDWSSSVRSNPAMATMVRGIAEQVVNNVYVASTILKMQSTVLAAGLNFDCSLFGDHDVCASIAARYTYIRGAGFGDVSFPDSAQTAGNLQLAFRLNPHWHIGAFYDQGTVIAGVDTYTVKSPQPLLGLYAVYSATGTELGLRVRVAAAYGSNTVNMPSDSSGSSASSSRINMQGGQVDAGYLFGLTEDLGLAPFAGLRFAKVSRGAGTETLGQIVVNYDAIANDALTAFGGLRLAGRLHPQVSVGLSLGVEQVLQSKLDDYGFSASRIGGFSFNSPQMNKTSGFVLGTLHYSFDRTQRLSLSLFYTQQSLDLPSGLTAQVRYSFGF